jgi:hypothetical protein
MKVVRGVLVILIMTEVYLIKDVAAPAEIPVLTGVARADLLSRIYLS